MAADGLIATTRTEPVSSQDPFAPRYAAYKTISQTSKDGMAPLPESTVYFDKLGRPLRKMGIGFGAKPVVEDTEYNALGQTLRVSNSYFFASQQTDRLWTTVEYDALGRSISQTAPDGSVTKWEYAGRTVTTTNVKLQRSTAEQNPAGLTTRVTDDAGGVIEHLYDAMGRLLQTFTEEEVEGKRTRLVTSFEYDALGRKTKMTDPSMGTWEYGYTVFGELKWQRDAKGTLVTFRCDALGRKLEQKA